MTEGQKEMLDIIGRNTGRLQALIEDLLTIGKIESGAVRIEPTEVPVRPLLLTVEEAMAPAVAAAGLRLEVDAAAHLTVHGDRGRSSRSFSTFSGTRSSSPPPAGPSACRAVQASAGWVEVSVADTGIGVPLRDQGHLFTRFFRASNATARAAQGAGLGLSIVENIVAAHGGEVSLTSTEGSGTVVKVRLPAPCPGCRPSG